MLRFMFHSRPFESISSSNQVLQIIDLSTKLGTYQKPFVKKSMQIFTGTVVDRIAIFIGLISNFTSHFQSGFNSSVR